MKKIFTVATLFIAGSAFSQSNNVGIGTTQPDNSAILDLSSSNKGFLMPRMSEAQRLDIFKPAQGLQVFQTDNKAGLYIFDGSEWVNTANSVSAATDPWLFGGNSISSTDFIGTTNSQPLVFKVNNVKAGFLDNSFTTKNTAFGTYAGDALTTGARNVAIGFQSLLTASTASFNVAIGTEALRNTTGSVNVGIGTSALLLNTTGFNNIAIGGFVLKSNTTGFANMGIGVGSLDANTTGNYNTAMGASALRTNTTGSNNVGLGFEALRLNTVGGNNIGIGKGAGYSTIGNNSIFIGTDAGYNETGGDKLYIANSNTTTPLIYGDFAAKFISIGDVDVAKRSAAGTGGYNLLVKGGILTEKVKVALASSADWADYVFEDDYYLMPLNKVEEFVNFNNHLPNVPSANQMAENGLEIAETSKMFMEKIEELTLYMIELDKEVKALKAENKELKEYIK